jgi:hypothetical protein
MSLKIALAVSIKSRSGGNSLPNLRVAKFSVAIRLLWPFQFVDP